MDDFYLAFGIVGCKWFKLLMIFISCHLDYFWNFYRIGVARNVVKMDQCVVYFDFFQLFFKNLWSLLHLSPTNKIYVSNSSFYSIRFFQTILKIERFILIICSHFNHELVIFANFVDIDDFHPQ